MSNTKRLLFDLETDGLLPDVSTLHCIVAIDLDSQEVYTFRPEECNEALTLLHSASELWGHNIVGYDLPVLRYLRGWNPKPATKIRDTLLLSRLIWPDIKKDDFGVLRNNPEFPKYLIGRHSLEAWGHRLKCEKGSFGKSTDWKEFSEEMLSYCVQDCKVNAKLAKLILSKNPSLESMELEYQFAELIHTQETNGVGFDLAAAGRLHATLVGRHGELLDELREAFPPRMEEMKTPAYWLDEHGQKHITKKAATDEGWKPSQLTRGPNRTKEHPFNPNSDDEIASRLTERYGWRPTEYTETGKPSITEAVLRTLPEGWAEVPLLKEYLVVDKRLQQLANGKQAWLKQVKDDNRVYGRVITNGCVTGRCSHKSPNMAQVPKVGKPYGEECRSLFVPRPGWSMVGCDASGLELRCLAHYMSRWDGGAYASEILEGDVHTANQHAANLESRDQAKTFIYGYMYGAGDAKIGSIVGGSAKEGGKLRKSFETKIPAIGKLRAAVQHAVKTRGHLKGLDGRILPIRSQHAALNTLLQSAGALVMKMSLIDFCFTMTNKWAQPHGETWALCLNVHDEFQIECEPNWAEAVGRAAADAIQVAGEKFNFKCPLEGEYKIGKNWAETH